MTTASAPRVWITRPRDAAERSRQRWLAAGVEAVVEPLLEIVPHDPDPDAVTAFGALDTPWTLILTSPRAAAAFRDWAGPRTGPAHVCAVGEATAAATRDAGFPVHQIATRATGADLAREVAGPGPVVYPASAVHGGDVPRGLRERGRECLELCLYTPRDRDLPASRWPDLLASVHVAAVYSPSAARRVAAGPGASVACAVLGPSSLAAANDAGLRVVARAADPGEDALIQATLDWWRSR